MVAEIRRTDEAASPSVTACAGRCGLVHLRGGKANKHNRLRCQLISSIHCSCCSLLLRSFLPGSHVAAWYPGPGGRHEQRRHLRRAAATRPHLYRSGCARSRCSTRWSSMPCSPRRPVQPSTGSVRAGISGADRAGWPSAPSRPPPSCAGCRAFSATNGDDKLRVN